VAVSFKSKLFSNPKGVKKAFKAFDRDGSGLLSYKEFCAGVTSLGLPIEPGHMKSLFQDMDQDGSGRITVEELAEQILKVPSIAAGIGGDSPSKGIPGTPDRGFAGVVDVNERTARSLLGPKSTGRRSSCGGSSEASSSEMGTLSSRRMASHRGQALGGPLQPSRSMSVPLVSPVAAHRSNAIDDLIRSHRNSPQSSPPPTASSATWSSRSALSHRSVPKTASERRALERVSMQRHTFGNNSSPVHRLPALASPSSVSGVSGR